MRTTLASFGGPIRVLLLTAAALWHAYWVLQEWEIPSEAKAILLLGQLAMYAACLVALRRTNLALAVIATTMTIHLGMKLWFNWEELVRAGNIVDFVSSAPTLYAAFLIGAHITRWRRFFWGGWLALGIIAYMANDVLPGGVYRFMGWPAIAGQLVLYLVAAGFFILLGAMNRRRRQERTVANDRAELAGMMERTTIAREMHDIVAHSLTGIIAQADGARYAAAQNPQLATEALATIADSARQALTQMRGLLSVLRTHTSRDATAPPGAAELEALLADAHRLGLNLTATGLHRVDSSLPELTQFTCYRIIQEMITNMLKHADPKEGTLTVTDEPAGWLTITASNPTPATAAGGRPEPATNGGFGLVGMAERVKAHGGTLTCGASAGTFTVTARLPR